MYYLKPLRSRRQGYFLINFGKVSDSGITIISDMLCPRRVCDDWWVAKKISKVLIFFGHCTIGASKDTKVLIMIFEHQRTFCKVFKHICHTIQTTKFIHSCSFFSYCLSLPWELIKSERSVIDRKDTITKFSILITQFSWYAFDDSQIDCMSCYFMDEDMDKFCIRGEERDIEHDSMVVSASSSFTETEGIWFICRYLRTEGKRMKVGEKLVTWCEWLVNSGSKIGWQDGVNKFVFWESITMKDEFATNRLILLACLIVECRPLVRCDIVTSTMVSCCIKLKKIMCPISCKPFIGRGHSKKVIEWFCLDWWRMEIVEDKFFFDHCIIQWLWRERIAWFSYTYQQTRDQYNRCNETFCPKDNCCIMLMLWDSKPEIIHCEGEKR